MKLNVKLFARARDLAGSGSIEVELLESSTVGDLRKALAGQFPRLAPIVPSLLVAIGTEYATDGTVLNDTTDVACFPPVSGG